MGLDDLVNDKTPDEQENPFLKSSQQKSEPTPQKRDRIVRADISLSRHYKNVTEEEAEELHKEWVYEMARAIEEEHENVKLTDWTALDSHIYVPGEDYPDPFWLEEE